MPKVPLLIAADFERGTAMRVEEGASFPACHGRGCHGPPGRRLHDGQRSRRSKRKRSACRGFSRPTRTSTATPTIPSSTRARSAKIPQRVSEFVAAFVRGVEENGGIATAKHFPGHGDTSTDSHLDLPTVTERPRASGSRRARSVSRGHRRRREHHHDRPSRRPRA